MFDYKKPCADCPFRKDQGPLYTMRPDRLRGIFDAEAFECHKTTGVLGKKHEPQQCAGVMSILHKEGRPNTIMQLAQRLLGFDSGVVDGSETYDSIAECIEGHRPRCSETACSKETPSL